MRTKRILKKISTLQKTEPSIELVPYTEERRESILERLLRDNRKVQILIDKASMGCSLGTIASALGVSSQTFNVWVHRGREDSLKYDPEFTLTPHMKLWGVLQEALSKARNIAESSLLTRNPEAFLKSKTAALLGDDWTDDKISLEEEEAKTRLDVGQTLLESLKLARKQGMDLNDIIDNNLLTLKTEAPQEKEEDMLNQNGILPNLFPSLPTGLAKTLRT